MKCVKMMGGSDVADVGYCYTYENDAWASVAGALYGGGLAGRRGDDRNMFS